MTGLEASGERRAARAFGYLRVSTREQAEMGAGLAAQHADLMRESERRGWSGMSFFEDAGASGKTLARPALQRLLGQLDASPGSVLVVAKLDRLSRSVADFASLLERSKSHGWGIVALDLGVDTTTPAGELIANVMAAVAQWERRTISQRTKDGLAVRRAAGTVLGRPAVLAEEVVHGIAEERAAGASLASIANQLNLAGVPTAHGGRQWWPSTVRQVLLGRMATSSS